ncbi:hypothetical protein KFE25_008438 [Diacronema lutheri]|uniref:fructose-bisphosphatase n=1 Tax=Diacronema lutheri TaxID=2081491 RepID=A0A8J5X563_DIALT|nr:hypothetical protein KFE25_008438 [Diacronema lutheri]
MATRKCGRRDEWLRLVADALRLRLRVPLWALGLVWLGARALRARKRVLRALATLSPPRHVHERTIWRAPPAARAPDAGVERAAPCEPLMTFMQYVLRACGERDGLARTLLALQTACRQAASIARRGLRSAIGEAEVMPGGVDQLEARAAEAFIRALSISDVCSIAVSSCDAIVAASPRGAAGALAPARAEQRGTRGAYAVVVTPLDGVGSADAAVAMGSIWSVFRVDGAADASQPPGAHVLRRGRELVAAGYALHGCASVLVCALGGRVDGFTLQPSVGEYELTRPRICMPERGRSCSVEHARTVCAHARRRSGTIACDVHRALLHGDLLFCPLDDGVRLLHEAAPMAFIAEAAGGAATDGSRALLDVLPTHALQRTRVFIGTKADVRELELELKCFADGSAPEVLLGQGGTPPHALAPLGGEASARRRKPPAQVGVPGGRVDERVRALELTDSCPPSTPSPPSHVVGCRAFKPATH